jgi:hypothetical protein
MTVTIVPMKTDREQIAEEAKRVLERAAASDLESVVLVGFCKDGSVYTDRSGQIETSKLVGLLEMVKHDVIRDWWSEPPTR